MTTIAVIIGIVMACLILHKKFVLADILRMIMPIRFRQVTLTWIVFKVMRWRIIYVIFYWLLFGIWMKERVRVEGDTCWVEYQGKEIVMSRDGIMSFLEIFHDDIYTAYDCPREGDVIFDVGAYVGMYSIKASTAANRIIAIEPYKTNIRHMEQNIYTYGLHNVDVVAMAAADSIGSREMYLSVSNFDHSLIYKSSRTVTVKTCTLDSIARALNLNRVDLIKIDAEGAELEILKGSHEILQQDNVRLIIAAYHDLPNDSPEMPYLIEWLKLYGFNIRVHRKQYIYAKKESK